MQRVKIRKDPKGKLSYHADRLVASAVTQTYEYMIDNGLEFGSIATGVAEVFLRVDEADPETVYYYLAEPRLDVGQGDVDADDDQPEFRYPFTAVARLLAFTLMSLQSPQRDQKWRREATKLLHVWEEDFEEILREMSSEERQSSPPSSEYHPRHYPVNFESPCLPRKRRRPVQMADVTMNAVSRSSSTSSDDDDDNDGSLGKVHGQTPALQKPSCPDAAAKDRTSTSTKGSSTVPNQSRQYCTQKCLLGIKNGQCLDDACPNVVQHRRQRSDRFHDLDLASFHHLVKSQLDADMDHNFQPLGIQGARGALFKITLASHGYTFVAKGTVEAFVIDLVHEGKIYDRLQSLQGTVVPVCLGNMDFEIPYFLDVGVKIIHMMFLAWGGESLVRQTPCVHPERLQYERERTIREVRKLGVLQMDERSPNLLWNESAGRVMLIDFERARVIPSAAVKKRAERLEPSAAPASEVSPYKKLAVS